MLRFKRPGPLMQMTLALVTMTLSIVLLADMMLGVTADRDRGVRQARQLMSESLAVQVAVLLQSGDAHALQETLERLIRRMSDVRSVGVRRLDGTLVVRAGPHPEAAPAGAASTVDDVRVPLAADGAAWGRVEVHFAVEAQGFWARLARSPLLRLLGFVALLGSVAYALYMRRALQHLDPASVIPDRVQRAFDTMNEGVVVLDARGRVLLANKAFRALHEGGAELRIGQSLSGLPWLAGALPGDPAAHPWMRAIGSRQSVNGEPLVIKAGTSQRQLAVACAPITDAGGAVRGCMATFDDLSELHRTNAALQKAMADVQAGREQLHRRNEELQRLATRDMLTGCLNRRAFMDAAPPALAGTVTAGCLMLDIDHFKSVNDAFGHGVGDRVIAAVAGVLMRAVRKDDLVCRYGGEEFCVIAPGLAGEGLRGLAERMRAQVEKEVGASLAEVGGLRVTISVGAATALAGETLASLIDRADHFLYEAKRGGRNRVADVAASSPARLAAGQGHSEDDRRAAPVAG